LRRCPTTRRGIPRAWRSSRSPRRQAGQVAGRGGARPRTTRRRAVGRTSAFASRCLVRSRTSGRRRRCGRRYACAARCSLRCERSRLANETRSPERARRDWGAGGSLLVRQRLSWPISRVTSEGSNRTAVPRCTAASSPRSTRRCTVRGCTWSRPAASRVVRSDESLAAAVPSLARACSCGWRLTSSGGGGSSAVSSTGYKSRDS